MKEKQQWKDDKSVSDNLKQYSDDMIRAGIGETTIAGSTINTRTLDIIDRKLNEVMEYFARFYYNRQSDSAVLSFVGEWGETKKLAENNTDKILVLASYVNAIQNVILMCGEIMFQPNIRDNINLIKSREIPVEYRSSIKNDENEVALRGIIAGGIDYLIFTGMRYIENKLEGFEHKRREQLLDWSLHNIIRGYQEMLCIFSFYNDEDKCLERLCKIWNNPSDVSMLSIGERCASDKEDTAEERNTQMKEYEFWSRCKILLEQGCFEGSWLEKEKVEEKISSVK